MAKADPTPTPKPAAGLLSESEAMRQAKSSGRPVEVSALTDERTLVTADPEAGTFRAEVTAGVARVRDSKGGWREPSTTLVQGADGLWRPEAAVADVAVSNGGGKQPLVSLADGDAKVAIGWPEKLPVPKIDGSTATYPEVFAGVDLVVQAELEAVETFLVVKTAAAGRNPAVRKAAFTFDAPGLSVKSSANGARSLRDADGVERLMVPPARMWDSKGAEAGLSRAEDRIGETDQARVGEVGLSVSKGTLTAAADASFLDDPATVYPVVIDPAVSMSQTYVVRVTETFRTINDMSVDAKLGYNGWTSPYYKSRMFYQFKWPLYSGTMIAAVQVQRVAHAFGAGFPVADAGPGKVALWTGELSVDDTDAELTTPTGELSISRVHNSFAGPAIGVQNQVFGPGWTPSLDAAGGFSGAELVDGTATDATLSLIDADGSTLRWQTSTKKRRTTVALPTAAYTPLDKATKTAGVTIAVTNSGNLPTVKLTDEDGVETTFVGVAAPAVKTDQVVFKATGVKDKATNETSTLAYDGAGRVSAIVAALPDGVSSCAPGTPAKGCRVLKLSYTSGGLLETVKAQVNLDADRTLASYSYDGQGRLATVTDSRPGLVTSYL